MKSLICGFCFSLVVLFANPLDVFPKTSNLINRIEGQVFDPNHRPVENINVELLNDVDSVIQRTKTNSGGRFTFSGIPNGRLTIKVLTFGTNLMEQTQEVNLDDLGRNDTAEYVEINLRYDKRSREAAIEKSPGVIFVQDIPAAAKTLYVEGIADLAKHQEKGLEELQAAIDIFPDYFDALDSLGKEFIARSMFEKGSPYLLRAIEINPRSSSSYYSLGYAFYQMKEYPAALEAAKATTLLVPTSVDAQVLYGTILRITGSYAEAEKTLLQANSLAKKMNGEAHWQLALLYNRLNRTQDTINELETFLKLVPDSPDKNKIRDLIAKLKTSANHNK
jgi:tetratricopeptide (TPR) repeat protein